MLEEVSRREKERNIIPDPDIDVFMKVTNNAPSLLFLFSNKIDNNTVDELVT
jgi:hypothetical protein